MSVVLTDVVEREINSIKPSTIYKFITKNNLIFINL